MVDYISNFNRRMVILDYQLDRFHLKYSDRLPELIDKLENKSLTDPYLKRTVDCLKTFLFDYSEKYGLAATEEQIKEYGNDFTGAMFIISGYCFNLMIGQGSYIQIFKIC